jgi:hypothetical protein
VCIMQHLNAPGLAPLFEGMISPVCEFTVLSLAHTTRPTTRHTLLVSHTPPTFDLRGRLQLTAVSMASSTRTSCRSPVPSMPAT